MNTLLLESAMAVVFFGVMLMLWRKVDYGDAALWVMVWATRVFASLNGAQHISTHTGDLGFYLGLQACSGCTLILILARSELRILRERLVRNIILRTMATGDVSGRGWV